MERSYDPLLLFLECLCVEGIGRPSFMIFFSCSKVGRDVVSNALKLLLEINSMDADLSHGSFSMEACKPVKFN